MAQNFATMTDLEKLQTYVDKLRLLGPGLLKSVDPASAAFKDLSFELNRVKGLVANRRTEVQMAQQEDFEFCP